MPATPVSLVPSIGPTKTQEPYLRVPSNLGEATGVNRFRAVQNFGQEIEKASNVVAQEVLQLQGLENETWAKNQDVDTMIKIGQAQSEFDQLEGENATAALPQHLERIKKIREDALQQAPNPMAKRMLDQSIARRVGFAIVDSGHKAGTQAKVANRAARTARVETARTVFDPTQPGTSKVAKETIESEVEQLGADAGLPREAIDNVKRKEVSKMYLAGIQRSYLTQPEAAKETFDKVKDSMDPNDREAAQAWVNRGMASKQTRSDVETIFQKLNFDPRKGPGQLTKLEEEGKKFIEKKGKDNPDYGHFLEGRIREKYNLGMAAHKDEQVGHEYSIGKFILGQNDKNAVVTIDGIVGPNAPKEVRDAYTALEPPAQRRINNWIAQAAKGGTVGWTTDGLRRYQQLRGMASDPESVEEFWSAGPEMILKENIPNSAKRELLNLQSSIKTKAENISLNQNMSLVEGMLTSAGLSRTQNREGYLQFRGAFEDQLRDFQGEKKTKVPPDEVRKIASRLLQGQGGFMGFFQTKMFQQGVPTEISDKIKAEMIEKGFQPTDEMIQRAYAYKLYKELYDKNAKGAPSPVGKTDKGPPKANPDLEGLGQ